MPTEILFRSDDLEVRRSAGDRRRCVVTFDSYHDVQGFDRRGFGEEFLASEGISAIHVLSRDNDWFQYAEMPAALDAIRAALDGTERSITYGSSMGGYGAIRFARALGVDTALAISPQFSVNPRKVPLERRWMQDQRRIRFRPELDGKLAAAPRTLIAYDPSLAIDAHHVDRVAAEIPIEPLVFPHASHMAAAFLADIGLLRRLVVEVLAGTLDAPAFLADAHKLRIGSATWMSELATCQPRVRPRTAIALARRAAEMAPDSPPILDRLAMLLREHGAFAGAIEAHERALALQCVPNYLWGYSKTLAAGGRAAEALAVAIELQRRAPDKAGYHRWAAELHEMLGDLPSALAAMRQAILHSPFNRGYRLRALRLEINARLRRWGIR